MATKAEWPRVVLLVLAALLLLLGVSTSLAYWLVQTERFRAGLENYLVDISGHDISLKGRIAIEHLFQEIRLALPDTTARLRAGAGGYERLRFTGLSLAVSPAVILSRGQSGKLSLDAESVAVIESSAPGSESTASKAPLSDELESLIGYIGDLDVSVNVDAITYVSRSAGGAGAMLDFERLSVRISRTNLQFMGYYRESKSAGYAIDLVVRNIESPGAGVDGLVGDLSLEVAPDFAAPEPLVVRSNLGLVGNEVSLPDVQLVNPYSRIEGNARFALDTPLLVRGRLTVEELDTAMLLESESESGPLFTETPVGFDSIAGLGLDLEMDVGIKAMTYGDSPVLAGGLRVGVKDDRLSVESTKLSFLNGAAKFRLGIEEMSGLPSVRLRFSSENFDLRAIPAETGVSYMTAGKADIIVSLKSTGISLDELAGSTDGYIVFATSDAALRNQYAAAIDTGLVAWTGSQLSRLMDNVQSRPTRRGEDEGPFRIGCASIKARIQSGYILASNSIVVDLPQNRLVGTGFADLHSERLGFGFATNNRRLLDLSAISTLRYVSLLGTLTSPRISLAPEESIRSSLEPDGGVARTRLPATVRKHIEPIPDDLDGLQCIASLD